MQVVKTITDLEHALASERAQGRSIGFVPTMGALHKGHLSLVDKASDETDCVVVSIFVNPTQFNNKEDLERYPRNLDSDLELLVDSKCDLVFAPSVNEMYPQPDTRLFDLGQLDKVMEGLHRPGHFNGVGQIVSKLLQIVRPHKAFFGLKDFQQVAVIKYLTALAKTDVEIVPCPIIREDDGLAMSSRNILLTPEERKNAPVIARSLSESRNFVPHTDVKKLVEYVVDNVNKTPGFEVEYFEVVDGNTLQQVDNWHQSDYIIGCIAVHVGKVRLIDNVIYKNNRHEH